MAIHTRLPIYAVTYDLLGAVVDAVKNMPRDVKGIVGERMFADVLLLTTLIERANRADDKRPELLQLLERAGEIETLLRVCVERKYISRGQYAAAILLTQSIGKQANGWRKSSSASPTASASRRAGPSDLQPGRAADPQGHRHAR